MGFVEQLLPLMQCPRCGGGFTFQSVATPEVGRDVFGILACGCDQYPVVDGVPVFLKDKVRMFDLTTGVPDVDHLTGPELVRLVAAGRTEEALVRCLAPAATPSWLPRLARRLSKSGPAERFIQARGRRGLREQLRSRDRSSLREVLTYFFGPETLGPDFGDYLRLRFTQPRYLAAMSLVSTLEPADQPVLDVACGIGHLAHYLTRRSERTAVVGVDFNFHHAWLARHWVAPDAFFVSADAGDGLPFRSGSMSATVVSDAYHYFPSRPGFVAEVARVAPGRCRMVTRVGNRAVMPNEGAELTLAGYVEELADPEVRVFSESRLVRDYRLRRNPLSGPAESVEALEGAKWLSFVSRGSGQRLTPVQWPHLVGRRALNPAYDVSVVGTEVRLAFRFPRPWYAFENHQSLEYHPERLAVTTADLRLLDSGGTNPVLDRLADSFGLVGLPDRY